MLGKKKQNIAVWNGTCGVIHLKVTILWIAPFSLTTVKICLGGFAFLRQSTLSFLSRSLPPEEMVLRSCSCHRVCPLLQNAIAVPCMWGVFKQKNRNFQVTVLRMAEMCTVHNMPAVWEFYGKSSTAGICGMWLQSDVFWLLHFLHDMVWN